MRLSLVAFHLCAMLAVASATPPPPPPCTDGSASYASFLASSARNALDSVVLGAFVGGRSDGCDLEVTPESDTFSIWSFIYSQQALLALPGGLSDSTRHHILEINDASSTWYRAFVGGGDDTPSNRNALAAIRTMLCHARKAREEACTSGGDGEQEFACCVFMQYESWLRVAELLSELIVERYGDTCGDGISDGEAVTLRSFADGFGAIVSDPPPLSSSEGGGSTATRAWQSTLAWAWRGVCDARPSGCPGVNVSSSSASHALASADAFSRQSKLALRASLLCVPAGFR